MFSILVVDDEPLVRLSVKALLDWEAQGFCFPYEAADGADALDLIETKADIDIVLLDVSMPRMDGLSFLRELDGRRSASGKRPEIIILSAYDDYPLVRDAFKLGVRDYVRKTDLDAESLLAALRSVSDRIGASPGGTAGAEKQEIDLLRNQFLKDILVDPATGNVEELCRELSISFEGAFWLCCFWVQDVEIVLKRYEDNPGRFAALFANALRQELNRYSSGDVVLIRQGHAAVFVREVKGERRALLANPVGAVDSDGGELERNSEMVDLFCRDVQNLLKQYLNVGVGYTKSKPLAGLVDVYPAYAASLEARSAQSNTIVLAKKYIRDHFADPRISLREVSEAIGLSKNYLSWEFTQETGETFTDYLTKVRIDEAKHLLASTTFKVYEICDRVGFSNVENFSRVFKKMTGRSPQSFKTSAY